MWQGLRVMKVLFHCLRDQATYLNAPNIKMSEVFTHQPADQSLTEFQIVIQLIHYFLLLIDSSDWYQFIE